MFEVNASAALNGRKLTLKASGTTNAHGFTFDRQEAGGLLTIKIKLTDPVKNDPSCKCATCGCTTPNAQSALNTTIDVPEGIQRIIVTAPLCGTVADFTL